jgi:hypothetical protein
VHRWPTSALLHIAAGPSHAAAHITISSILEGNLPLLLGCSREQLQGACQQAGYAALGALLGSDRLGSCLAGAGGGSPTPGRATGGTMVLDSAALRAAIAAGT